jgi:hypothetical protein
MKTLTYIGHVSDAGDIKLPKRLRAEVGKAFAGKDIVATFARPKKTRSSEQNRYYWGVVVRMVCEGFQALGNPVNPDNEIDTQEVHEFLKRRFLQPEIFVDANGEAHEIGWSTSRLSTSQMMDYIAQVQQFAAEFLNIVIPEPGEQVQLWQE